MLIEQIFELRGLDPGRICTPITGCFHDKIIISNENLRADCYLLLKYCRKQCTLHPHTWTTHQGNFCTCHDTNLFSDYSDRSLTTTSPERRFSTSITLALHLAQPQYASITKHGQNTSIWLHSSNLPQ